MDTRRWHQLEELFEAALEQPVGERRAYLEDACGADEELRGEVLSLLAAYEEAPGYFEELGCEVRPVAGGEDDLSGSFPAGPHVGPYEIQEKLGGGGMGVVYRAQDTRLGRTVALKFLPPAFAHDEAAKERFYQEAKAASALDHPHICPVHDIGEAEEGRLFIVMPFYDGETLKKKIARGPLPVEEAAGYARQIAEGLQAAHAAGIIHRDIKPANVMITREGQVKIVDFGVAKTVGVELTRRGATLGTAAYMSPEQVRGEELDHRTDLWSLGVVVYEMLTGRRPFMSSYEQAVLYKILREAPRPADELRPEACGALAELTQELLQKDPADRPASGREVARRLKAADSGAGTRRFPQEWRGRRSRWIGAAAAAAVVFVVAGLLLSGGPWRFEFSWAAGDGGVPRLGEQSLAVLPFTYLAAQDSSDYFSQGMTDELLNRLSQIEDLSVIGRTSMMQYRQSEKSLSEIGRELGVAYFMDGSVQQVGRRVRIQAQLIDARTGEHLWAKSFTRPFEDVLRLQSEITREIASALELELVPDTRRQLADSPAVDSTAYALYLKGRYLRFQIRGESLAEAVRLLRRSTAIDSTFAPAWAVLSTVAGLGTAKRASDLAGIDGDSLARAAARRALALDSTSAEAHIAMGVVRVILDGYFPAAGPHFKRAVELNPGLANANRAYGWYFMQLGRFAVAERYLRKAARLDPVFASAHSSLGANELFRGNYRQAKRHLQEALTLQPTHVWARAQLGSVYLAQDSIRLALRELRKAAAANPPAGVLARLGQAYATAGRRDSALAVAERIRQMVDPASASTSAVAGALRGAAAVYTALGRTEQALDLLERAELLGHHQVFQWFGSLRGMPRFERLLEKAGLDDASVRQTMEKLGERPS